MAQANKEGNTLGAATLGFTAAMAAYGGFFIPKSCGSSIALTGAPMPRCGALPRLLPPVHCRDLGGTTRERRNACC